MKEFRDNLLPLAILLLSVSAIAALIFAVIDKKNERDARGTCISNERQMGLAVSQYVEDNDGHWLNVEDAKDPNISWRTMIYPYLSHKACFQCPRHDDKSPSPDGFPRSYAANYTGDYSGGKKDKGNGAFGGPGSQGVTLKDISNISTLIMLCEVSRSSRPDFNIDNLAAFRPHSMILWAGHSGGSNYLFVDGHVEFQYPLTTQADWHRNSSIPLSANGIQLLKDAQTRAGK